jgi:Tol biopolymer transport system component
VTLTAGTRLGPYEVIALLGAGGMGEVYRARDTRLDRTVALKILPQHANTTTMARERFEREARAISALNHPNICTLFDVGSHDGTEYLVMELVDGEQLKGPMPLHDVLRVGAAIADALAKAHRAGIVHRDLKPANIMLTKSGPKLLDFGLARKAEEAHGHDATTVIGKAITTEGTLLGTLPYMAPEQLEGKPADARTDVFALGAVLYEMITGRRAFQAESQASLITKIMSEQPPPIRELQPIAPAALNRLVMKCLAKDPAERWQAASDVADELRWIGEGGEAPTAIATRTNKRSLFIVAGIAALLALGLIAALLRKPAAQQPTLRFEINQPPNGQFWIGNPLEGVLAVSPDGTRAAYMARGADRKDRIWLRDLGRGTAAPIEGTDEGTSPFWSPDGRTLGFVAAGKLKTVSLAEGGVQSVCDVATSGVFATWLHDGSILYTEVLKDSSVLLVPAGGGTAKKLGGIPKLTGASIMQAIGAPDHFYFCGVNTHDTDLWIGDVGGGEARKVMEHVARPIYVAPYLLFIRQGTLFAQRFDESKLRLEGKAEAIADGVWSYLPIGQAAIAAGGDTIVYAGALRASSMRWLDRTGRDLGEALPPNAYGPVMRFSPDGKRLVLDLTDVRTGSGDIWIADLGSKSLGHFTYSEHDYGAPLWSPDGRTIAYASDTDAPPYIFTKPVNGGEARAVTKPGQVQFACDWLRDGRIFFNATHPKSGTDLMLTTADGNSEVWLQTPANEAVPRVSPDQKWVAYASDDSGRLEIYVAPLDQHSDRTRVSIDGGWRPVWSRDGRELYFFSGTELFAVPVKMAGDSIDVAAPAHVYSAKQDIESVEVAPDGRLLVMSREVSNATAPLQVIVGWRRMLQN